MGYAKKSPWVIHYDGSSCNGCDIEVLAALCPGFDAERFGVINTGNPKHADIFLVTGSVNEQNAPVIKQIYDQMVEPKVVAACGICACSGGIFRECYNVKGGIDSVIPVDVYLPGCAVRPESIIDAVVQAIEALDAKSKALKEGKLHTVTSDEYAEMLKKKNNNNKKTDIVDDKMNTKAENASEKSDKVKQNPTSDVNKKNIVDNKDSSNINNNDSVKDKQADKIDNESSSSDKKEDN